LHNKPALVPREPTREGEGGMLRSSAIFPASLGLVLLLGAAPAHALSATYALTMTGAQEVPGPGDPDGTGTGTITLDDTNILGNGTIIWSIAYTNLEATISGFHIHTGAVGVSGPILVSLGTTGVPGVLSGTNTTTPVATIDLILANPTNFYVNIHTLPTYSGGAIRGQLGTLVPEPGTGALLGLGVLAIAWRRRASR
jgi:hypothetical protein